MMGPLRVLVLLSLSLSFVMEPATVLGQERTFTVDHKANTFLMDGKPFRYVSGSFHYFRALPNVWEERLNTMKLAGLNVVDTYVEWALHNPRDGLYDYHGIANVERFIETAQKVGLYVILRPGPYICAERDNGGHPHWLFTKYPNIKVRTSDANYQKEVAKWYNRLMTKLEPFMYGNGGPIIMVQVENEYGVYEACDKDYLIWLRDETEKYVNGKALLFTTDIPNDRMECGKIEGVFATTDFGIDRIHEIDDIWSMLRKIQPTGPLVNSEFYPGWLTHWQEENQRRDAATVANSLRTILQSGASVNFYMFFGGTNFGFTAGANNFGYGGYNPDITSYDYDAVMTESGGITKKFELVRNVIAEFMDVPKANLSEIAKREVRISFGEIQMKPIATLLSGAGREILTKNKVVMSENPQSFEQLDQYSGLVLYETTLPTLEIDPTMLTLHDLRDRALIYVDEQLVGTLSRENTIFSLPLHKGWGSKLQILVENQGRINFDVANDTKGLGGASIQKLDGTQQKLTSWSSTPLPLDSVLTLTEELGKGMLVDYAHLRLMTRGPVVYQGDFVASRGGDTYLNTDGWGKGVAYMNNFNLGRYWPLAGPQRTLYVPRDVMRMGFNTLTMIEYQRANRPKDSTIPIPTVELTDTPLLDGY